MPSATPSRIVVSVAFALASLPAALAVVEGPVDPITGLPRYNYSGYLPNKSIALVATAFFSILFVVLLCRWFQYRFSVMLYLTFGCLAYAAGMGIRYQIHDDPYSLGPYIASILLVLISPVFFILVDYMLFSRIVQALEMEKHLLIRARWISRGFVISDASTFLLQCAGGGLQSSAGSGKIGTTIILIGIIAQLVSFVFFIFVALHWAYKIKKLEPEVWSRRQWKRLFFTLLYTCIGFLIRSVFRSIELAQGYKGYLSTREGYLYCLDSLPLFLAIIAYTWTYPGQYLGSRAIHPIGSEGRGIIFSPNGSDGAMMEEGYKMEENRRR